MRVRCLLQALLDIAAVGIGVASLVISASIGFVLFLLIRKWGRAVPELIGSVASLTEENEADWGARGGLNRMANMQATKMLSQIERAVFDSQVPFGKLIRSVAEKLDLPLDEWIEEMPFGLLALAQNPKLKALVGPLQALLPQLAAGQQAPTQSPQRAY